MFGKKRSQEDLLQAKEIQRKREEQSKKCNFFRYTETYECCDINIEKLNTTN